MGRLDDQVALITGGEGSVGLATARAFVREGCRVALAGISADGLAAARVELGDEVALFTRTDVTSAASVKAAVSDAISRWGRLDVVFSNAGIAGVIAPSPNIPTTSSTG